MRLKNEIKAKNTTQEWVACKIGVPLSTFRKWMTRKTYPTVKEGIELASLLDTSAEYLVMGTNPEGLSDEEKKLIRLYRRLSKADRENTMLAVAAWLGKNSL